MPVDDEALFSALAVIRAAPAGSRAERPLAPAWRTVVGWLEQKMPGHEREDLRQEALVKIVRGLDGIEAKSASSVAAWAHRVAVHASIDLGRAQKTSAVDRAIADRQGEPEAIDRIAGEPGAAIVPSALEDLGAELEDAIEGAVAFLYPSPHERIAPRAQARARLYRHLLGLSIAGVRARLDWHAPLSDDLISKWIERGQVVLDTSIQRWAAEDLDSRATLGERLREELGQRRLDAGRARTGRKSRPDGSGRRLSVGRASIRLRGSGVVRTSGSSRRAEIRRPRGVR